MKYNDAMAISRLATLLGNHSLSATFAQRAKWIQQEYLRLLWNPRTQFFAVYKENLQHNGNYNCQYPIPPANSSDPPTSR